MHRENTVSHEHYSLYSNLVIIKTRCVNAILRNIDRQTDRWPLTVLDK